MGKLIVILGGARGGKSRTAEAMARQMGGEVLFVATASAGDDEMRQRIAAHQKSRPAAWRTLEAECGVAEALARVSLPEVVLLDCITLLVANVLMGFPEDVTQDEVTGAALAEIDGLLGLVRGSDATWIMVSNEVGMGVVPPTRLGRQFRDALGAANQHLAAAADEVILMVAGLPWHLKPAGRE